jgi:hypothetical protein
MGKFSRVAEFFDILDSANGDHSATIVCAGVPWYQRFTQTELMGQA